MSDSFILPDDAHPVIRQGLEYWRSSAPGPGRLPGRQHIDPLGMPALLPYAWLLEVHPPAAEISIPRFRFRLVGSHVDLGLGGQMTGSWLHDLETGFDAVSGRSRSFVDAATTGQISHRRGAPRFSMNSESAELERVMMPLASDGRNVDMLLGFTVFYDGIGTVLRGRL
ncbi:MAG: PAS domain-containing protein [Ferrovibrio sp.]